MERVDKTDKSFEFFFGAGCGPKTLAKHHIPLAKIMSYQPLLIKPILSK